MRRTVTCLVVVAMIGAAISGSAAAAAEAECQVEQPRWEVDWTSEGTVTAQRCGGTAEIAPAAAVDTGGEAHQPDRTEDGEPVPAASELPLTTGPALAVGGIAAALVALGAGLLLVARRRRTLFTA